ncbi:hypothetical protein VTO42DRAFT_8398 [Malbranchea cinnamomea]
MASDTAILPSAPHKTASSLSLPPSQFVRLQPHTYLLAHLSPSDSDSRPPLRINGRLQSQFRPALVNTGSLTHCNGSAVVRIGDTAAVCGVRAEILSTDDIVAWKLSTAARPSKRRRTEKSQGAGIDVPTRDDTVQEDDDDGDDDSEIAAFNLLVPNLSLNTGCSPSIPPGSAPTPLAQALSHQLLALLHSSRLVRAEDLRIWHQPPNLANEDTHMTTEGEGDSNDAGSSAPKPEIKAFWTLYIDVLVISLAGNAFDAAWAAVVAALRDTRLPKAWWDMDSEMVLCSDSVADSKKLRLRGMPMASSFCVFEGDATGDWKRIISEAEDDRQRGKSDARELPLTSKRWILADPDAFEESLCQERACVVLDKDAQGRVKLLRLEKNGGFYLGKEELKEIVDLAAERWEEWKPLLEASVS